MKLISRARIQFDSSRVTTPWSIAYARAQTNPKNPTKTRKYAIKRLPHHLTGGK
jgi:hypothetical protein